MVIEKNFINEKYLLDLNKNCRESLKKNYNLDRFNFKDFEMINAFLINEVISQNNFNLLINILDKKKSDNLYVPTIMIAAIFSFYKNYIYNDDHPYIPIVGEIVQKGGLRLEVIEITDDKKFRLKAIDKENTYQETDEEGIKTFFVTTGDLSERRVRQRFDHYKEFFDKIFSGIGSKLPSKFEYKTVIVAKKEIIQELKDFTIDSKKINSAIPFKYLTKTGTPEENLPIDPMIYIVNDYETIRDFLFKQDNAKVDTIIFIGETKYKEWKISISQDLINGKFKNAIFIGESDIDSFPNLHKWNWQLPEIEKLWSVRPPTPLDVIEVENELLSQRLKEYDDLVKRIERDYIIELNELQRFTRRIFPVVIPYLESRLKTQIVQLLGAFEKICEENLQEQFDRLNEDYSASYTQLKECFNNILHALDDGRAKLEALQKSKKFYLVVPKDMKQAWEADIDLYGLKKAKIISYEDFKKLPNENPKKVFFLAFYGSEFFNTIISSQHEISLILYKEEKIKFETYLQRFKKELEKEYTSSDRLELCGVEYPGKIQGEDIGDMDEIENSVDEIDSIHTVGVDYKIIFEDGESKILDSNKSVVLLKGGQRRIERISNLMEGDEINIYENTTKEQLYDIAVVEDKEGKFQQFEEDSKTWKLYLRDFYKQTCAGDFEKLFMLLKQNGLDLKSEATLKKWLSEEDRENFPARIRNLIAIKKTINRPELDGKFDSIKRSRKSYRSIMIALGKDMSSEIMEYIMSTYREKGKILRQFSDSQIAKFMDANAPRRRIKEIGILEDYNGSE